MNSEGLNHTAILLLSMGEDLAAEVMRHFSPKEVQKITNAMAALGNVTKDKVDQALIRFDQDVDVQAPVSAGDNDYIRRVLGKAVGDDKAGLLMDRLGEEPLSGGLETLRYMDPQAIAELIEHEHPQIIASIMVHLERDEAAEVLKHFTDRTRSDVMLRIATLDGIQPAALRELNEVLSKLLSSGDSVKKVSLGGVKTAAEILNFVGSAVEISVLDTIKEYDGELAQNILDEMFVFENLADMDDRSIQTILRDVQSESLIIALKGSSESLREKIFKNMSSRAAEMLREDLASKGPVRLSEVEAEQKEILKTVRRLAEEGQVMMGGGGGDGFV